ncbi:MAG: ribonuclease HIII [Lentisphaeria bacterium]|nr:ribonuclease HIII [Lentisphaeria bacterium]
MEKKNSFVFNISEEDSRKLLQILEERAFLITSLPYARYKAVKEKVNVTSYESGKLVIQGAGSSDFVEFILEPEILKERAFDPLLRNEEVKEVKEEAAFDPASFTPHAGIDESGKGDFFGPLVIACAFVPDSQTAEKLLAAGVKDSKQIKSDAAILKIASLIRNTLKDACSIVAIGPEAYNNLYERIGNLNHLLAWGHARALTTLLEKHPECKKAIGDKFADERLVRNAFAKMHRDEFELEQMVRAESDVAVAAASILARAEFVRRVKLLEEQVGMTLPKGASNIVDKTAKQLAVSGGEALMRTVAKMHFRTAYRALGLPEPERKTFFRR